MAHEYGVGDRLTVKSGRVYLVERVRTDEHPKLKGELGYSCVMLREGKPFGPIRLLRESAFTGKAEGR